MSGNRLLIATLLFLLPLWSSGALSELYELRTYTSHEGKLDELTNRFKKHTVDLFEKHDIRNVGYWTHVAQKNTLVYIIAHPDKEKAQSAWKNFSEDPAWKKVRSESMTNGALVKHIESVYMVKTHFSP